MPYRLPRKYYMKLFSFLRFVSRAKYESLEREFRSIALERDILSAKNLGLIAALENRTKEVNDLERMGLELFKARLEHRFSLFGRSEEQFSVLRTAYPKLGDLYSRRYK